MNRTEKMGLFWIILSINFYMDMESGIGQGIFCVAIMIAFTVFYFGGDKNE